MIRFAPDPTPELRAARQAWIVALFLRAIELCEQLPRRTRLRAWHR